MDDFIIDPNQKPKKPSVKKKKPFLKTVTAIIGIILILVIGFLIGYFGRGEVIEYVGGDNASVISEAYQVIVDQWYDVGEEEEDFLNNALHSIVEATKDTYISYFSIEEANEYNDLVNGTYEGIGIGFTTLNNGIMVTKVYEGSPSRESGLLEGDIITKADDKDLGGLDSEELKGIIRGKEGTEVKLHVVRKANELDISVKRSGIDTSLYAKIVESDGQKIGYVEITTFGNTTAAELEKALVEFELKKVNKLIIDVRDNGGGYVSAAKDILDLFVKENEIIYQMQGKSGPAEVTKASSRYKFNFAEGYVLINGDSASASELVAAGLQETVGFKVVGTKSYGKGTAQRQMTLSNGGIIKYTFAKWLTPKGNSINEEGIEPDIKIINPNITTFYNGDFEGEYKYDSVGEHVASMQKMLEVLGYEVDRTDGYFSKATENALMQFEKEHYLESDGIYTEDERLLLIGYIKVFVNDDQNDVQFDKLISMIK